MVGRSRGGISLGKLVLVAMLLAGCGRRQAPPYRTDAITRGPVSEVVNATGDVSAIGTVNVGSQVAGIVDRLYVDFNSVVKRAQLLASLDPRLFRAQLEKAEASLASANANVQKAQAAYSDSLRIASRQQELLQQGLISQAELETTVATRDQNAAASSAAKASVLQAKADRDMAATNLAFTRIESPIDGIVVSRSVDVGQTVAAALQEATPQRHGVPPQARTASAAARGTRDGGQQPGRAGRIYKLENGKPVPVFVRVGFSDGQRTELIEGLADGDRVIVGGGESRASGQSARRRGPF